MILKSGFIFTIKTKKILVLKKYFKEQIPFKFSDFLWGDLKIK